MNPLENRETITKLENLGFEGTDATLAIALGEYGMTWRKLSEEVYEIIYGVECDDSGNYSGFERCEMNMSEMTFESYDWADKEALLSFCESTTEKHPYFLYDLVAYYGTECVFGSSYGRAFEIGGLDEW